MKKAFRKAGNFFQIIGGYFLALCCLFGSLLFYNDSTSKLETADKYIGFISSTKITNNPSNISGKYNMNKNVFSFTLNGLNEILGIYNSSQNYDSYLTSMKVGDQVKVYFKAKNTSQINIDVYQIEKGNTIILELNDYTLRNKIGSLIALIGGIIIIIIQTKNINKTTK
jgi:hypothetical protein